MIPSFSSNQSSRVGRLSPEDATRPAGVAPHVAADRWLRRVRLSLAVKPHLTALLVISGLFAVTVAVLGFFVDRIEARYVHAVLAADEGFHSLRSLALERSALRQTDLLPLYGSSELVKPVPDRATLFFHTYPTGFSIFPIGKAGTYPLIMLQHIASMGPELRGRKVAISLSSGWFREDELIGDQYRGNFLLPTAREFLFSTHISFSLRRAVARRFLHFPDTLAGDPVANFAAHRLVSGSRLSRYGYWCAWPLGRLQIFVGRCQDHFEVLKAAWRPAIRHVVVSRVSKELDWEKLIAAAAEAPADGDGQDQPIPWIARAQVHKANMRFLTTLKESPQWGDLNLLLRTLHEVGAQPLLLCTPIKGRSFAKEGVSHSTREVFYERLARMAARYDFPLYEFTEHDGDRNFVYDRNDHLSEQGWMYYNQVLDDFMQGRDEGD